LRHPCFIQDGETVVRTPDAVLRTVPHVTRRAGDVNPPVTVRLTRGSVFDGFAVKNPAVAT
jgi:hypothetical protein